MALEFREYLATVTDQDTGTSARYTIRAVSEEHAARQAKDGFTGLLGAWQSAQARLQVDVELL